MSRPNGSQLTLFAEAPPARTSQSQEREQEWLESVLAWPSDSWRLWHKFSPPGSFGRTCRDVCPPTEDGTLEPSSEGWGNAGMGSPIAFLTLNTSEFHSAADASSLSDILETGGLPQRYYLSPTACRGILRRAEKRGKELPPALEQALRAKADTPQKPCPVSGQNDCQP